MLTDAQIERYSRQIILPQVGGRGQERLCAATVILSGAASVVEPAATYLAAAGLGNLWFHAVDGADRLIAQLHELNRDCRGRIISETGAVNEATAVVEARHHAAASDFSSACLRFARPLVWSVVTRSTGMAALLCHGDAPCFGCLRIRMPPAMDPSSHDVFGDLTSAFIGSVQATETIKLVLGLGGTTDGRVLTYDAIAGTVDEVRVRRDPGCTACGRTAAPSRHHAHD